MLCRAKVSSISQVALDAATDTVVFFLTGGVSFCSGVDAPEVLDSEPKVTPPSHIYTPPDPTSTLSLRCTQWLGHLLLLPSATLPTWWLNRSNRIRLAVRTQKKRF